MRRQSAQPIGSILVQFMRENGLEKPLLEKRVVEQWPVLMGETVARLTRSVEIKDGVLFVRLSSAALRAHLFEIRFDLVKKLNDAVGNDVIRDVRLL